ncbi:MAG TPA: hypothetical protein VGK67_20850 [Myxococcales bacterium]|jgi:hypothetical protein
MLNDRGHLSAFTLDRLLLKSLPEAESTEARAHLEACESCRTLFSQMESDQKKFEAHVFARTLPAVSERAKPPSLLERLAAMWRIAIPVTVAGGIALMVAYSVRQPGPSSNRIEEPELGIKGGPSLQVFAARGESVFPVKEGTRLRPQDRIRFVVQRDEADGFLLVASIDAARKVSVYFPAGGSESAPIEKGRVELPGSIELDETLGSERVFAFFSPKPLAVADVQKALERWPVPPRLDAKIATLAFEKEPPK